MEPKAILENAVKILDAKKGMDLTALEITEISAVADYFLLVTGTSSTHVRALADELEEKLRELAEYQHTPYEELHASMWNNGGINDLYEKLLAEKSLALLGRSARIAA